ncbi:MAG: DUF2225 domain-containing protein [Leptospiraceae bacterium]|nr:DUF2225 domain-containing protein [Leptospiraceae bacterium]MDW7976313.1 DUF2225 domain-containing protein [Leptospiraceae bacterium]
MSFDNQRNISYRMKDPVICPVCGMKYFKEMLLTGGGRLIAGNLTPELRRLYVPSKKFGVVIPLIYPISVCPSCFYASFGEDFTKLQEEEVSKIKLETSQRKDGIQKIFGMLNFEENRNLVTGAASYILALDCYQKRGIQVAPTPKKAVISLRAAWLIGDLHEKFPDLGYDKIQKFLYHKAIVYYKSLLDIMSSGVEPHDQFVHLLGPDTDKNWGFDGVIYLNGYLNFKFIEELTSNDQEKLKLLENSKRMIGKLYGMGKASKAKPSTIMNLARDLYESINKKIEEITGEKVTE